MITTKDAVQIFKIQYFKVNSAADIRHADKMSWKVSTNKNKTTRPTFVRSEINKPNLD